MDWISGIFFANPLFTAIARTFILGPMWRKIFLDASVVLSTALLPCFLPVVQPLQWMENENLDFFYRAVIAVCALLFMGCIWYKFTVPTNNGLRRDIIFVMA